MNQVLTLECQQVQSALVQRSILPIEVVPLDTAVNALWLHPIIAVDVQEIPPRLRILPLIDLLPVLENVSDIQGVNAVVSLQVGELIHAEHNFYDFGVLEYFVTYVVSRELKPCLRRFLVENF